MNCELEEAYFGERLGTLSLYQISRQQFQLECLTSNLSVGDSTGLRAYHGCHVIIRFVASFPHFIIQKNVVELGCGIGVFGLVGTHINHPSLLVLTDREARGSNIVRKNIQYFSTLSNNAISTPTCYECMKWSDTEDTKKVLELCKQSLNENTQFYDVVLGSELMYFNTDVELMIQAVMSLTNERGLFIHGHVFRGHHQEHQLIYFLSLHNWTTLEIPHKEFISTEELKQHAEWYNARPLISGPVEVIAKLKIEHPTWREFQEELIYEEEENDDAAVFSLFE